MPHARVIAERQHQYDSIRRQKAREHDSVVEERRLAERIAREEEERTAESARVQLARQEEMRRRELESQEAERKDKERQQKLQKEKEEMESRELQEKERHRQMEREREKQKEKDRLLEQENSKAVKSSAYQLMPSALSDAGMTRVASAPGRVGAPLSDFEQNASDGVVADRPSTAINNKDSGEYSKRGHTNAAGPETLSPNKKKAWCHHDDNSGWDGDRTDDTIGPLAHTDEVVAIKSAKTNNNHRVATEMLRRASNRNQGTETPPDTNYEDSFDNSEASDMVEEELQRDRSSSAGNASQNEEVEDEMYVFSSPTASRKQTRRSPDKATRASVGEDSVAGSYADDFEDDFETVSDSPTKAAPQNLGKVIIVSSYDALVARFEQRYSHQRKYWGYVDEMLRKIDRRNIVSQMSPVHELLSEVLSVEFPAHIEDLFQLASDELRLYDKPISEPQNLSVPLASASIAGVVAGCIKVLAVVIQMCLALTDSSMKGVNSLNDVMELLHETRLCIFALHTTLIDFCTTVIKFEHLISTAAGPVSKLRGLSMAVSGRELAIIDMVGLTEDAWTQVLSEVAILFGLLTTVSGHGGSYMSLMTDDVTGETRQIKKYFGEELSVSSQWCLVAALCDMMRWSRVGSDGYRSGVSGNQTNILKKQCLKSLGAVIAVNGNSSLHEMLFAQQVPKALCEMLVQDFRSTGVGKGLACTTTVIASAAHVLALLLHTTGHHWFGDDGYSSFPLKLILSGPSSDKTKDEEGSSNEKSHDATAAALRHRICGDVLKWLLESRVDSITTPHVKEGSCTEISKKLAVLLSLFVEITDTSMSELMKRPSESDINNVIVLQSALGRILFHLTNEADVGGHSSLSVTPDLLKKMSRHVSTYSRVITSLFQLIRFKFERPSTAPSGASAVHHHIDTFSLGLAILTLRNLVQCNSLTYGQMSTAMELALHTARLYADDIRILPACCFLIAAILASRECLLSLSDGAQLTLDQQRSLLGMVINSLFNNDARVLLSTKRILDGTHPNIAAMKEVLSNAPIVQGLTGSNYGSRSEGAMDGILLLLEILAEKARVQLFSLTVLGVDGEIFVSMKLVEAICQLIQAAGYGELSPIGHSAAMSVLSAYGNMSITSNRNDVHSKNSPNKGLSSLTPSSSSMHLADFDRHCEGTSGVQVCTPERLLQLSYQHGLVGLLSLTLLPQQLMKSDLWCSIRIGLSPAPPNITVAMIRAAFSLYRSMLMASMMAPSNDNHTDSHMSSPVSRTPDNSSASAALSGRSPGFSRNNQFTAYSQALFDTTYRAHLMRCMVDCTRHFGRFYDAAILRDLVQILSDLVHMSNKFIVQLMDCDGIECLTSIGLFSYYRVDEDDFQFDHEDGMTI